MGKHRGSAHEIAHNRRQRAARARDAAERARKQPIERARRKAVQDLARSKFPTLRDAWNATRAEVIGMAEDERERAGWCVGVDLKFGPDPGDQHETAQYCQLSGHVPVSDSTWDQTGGLCWRCAYLAAWHDEHPEEEHPSYVCYVRGKAVVRRG
jgi:hypothetical protein